MDFGDGVSRTVLLMKVTHCVDGFRAERRCDDEDDDLSAPWTAATSATVQTSLTSDDDDLALPADSLHSHSSDHRRLGVSGTRLRHTVEQFLSAPGCRGHPGSCQRSCWSVRKCLIWALRTFRRGRPRWPTRAGVGCRGRGPHMPSVGCSDFLGPCPQGHVQSGAPCDSSGTNSCVVFFHVKTTTTRTGSSTCVFSTSAGACWFFHVCCLVVDDTFARPFRSSLCMSAMSGHRAQRVQRHEGAQERRQRRLRAVARVRY